MTFGIEACIKTSLSFKPQASPAHAGYVYWRLLSTNPEATKRVVDFLDQCSCFLVLQAGQRKLV